MFKTVIVQQDKIGRAECVVCLLHFDLAPVMVRLSVNPWEYVCLDGYVCPGCLDGGADRIVVELRNRADSFRRCAEELDRWTTEPIELPAEIQSLLRSSDPLWSLAGKPPASDKIQ